MYTDKEVFEMFSACKNRYEVVPILVYGSQWTYENIKGDNWEEKIDYILGVITSPKKKISKALKDKLYKEFKIKIND